MKRFLMKRKLRPIPESILPGRLFATIQSIRSRNYQKQLLREWGFIQAAQEFVSVRGTTVSNGPFMGMMYPRSCVFNRHSIPFLLGTYELEIQPVIEEVISKRFERIIDVGCAEGYYAVGLARRTDATIYAFDCEPRERSYCREMAHKNGVGDRVHVRSWCNGQTLKALAVGRCLVISDCEGYEIDLFSNEVIAALKSCDLIIELHDEFLGKEVSPKMLKRFKDSHNARMISFQGSLDGFDMPEKWRKFAREVRAQDQRWVYLTARPLT